MIKVKFKNNKTVPILGLGTWRLRGNECIKAIEQALEIGYRHIDTADMYQNHKEVGRAIKSSKIKRSNLFVTSKIWPDNLQRDNVFSTTNRILEELQTDYLDLLLIHWPNKSIPVKETLSAMNDLKCDNKIISIGVSNFTIPLLKEAIESGIEIVNNQVEIHPSYNQLDLESFCKTRDITLTAYAPLGRGIDAEIPLIKDLSKKYNKTPYQIILNWIFSLNIIAIPKSADKNRLEENFRSLDFRLENEDIDKINKIPQKEKLVI